MKYWVILFLLLLACFKAKADEVECLALNIYHEARNQPTAGKLAVAQVTLNRVKHDRFPNTICGVVYQGYYLNNNPIKHKCQFSWWCDGKSDKPKEIESWNYALMLARHMHEGIFDNIDVVKDATHYHAVYVKPYWTKEKKKVKVIADHIFYK
jgi:N-acetylmuramoyl-L-alanine amidase|tara:strand:- start:128 stop:586 length:459 start_codon:yes stop_codon:yes gene_type:complete